MAKKAQPVDPPHVATAIDALRAMKIPRAQAEELARAVGGNTVEEVLSRAFQRHQALREGRLPPTAPKPTAPAAVPIAQLPPLQSRQRQSIAQLAPPLGAIPLPTMPTRSEPPPITRSQLARQALSEQERQARIAAKPAPGAPPLPPMQFQYLPGTPQPPPNAPIAAAPVPQQQQSIPGFSPPGGPGAALQPEAQQAPLQPPPIVAAPINKPRIRVRLVGRRIKPYDIEAYRRLPIVSSQKEVDALPKGAHFVHDQTGKVWVKN